MVQLMIMNIFLPVYVSMALFVQEFSAIILIRAIFHKNVCEMEEQKKYQKMGRKRNKYVV